MMMRSSYATFLLLLTFVVSSFVASPVHSQYNVVNNWIIDDRCSSKEGGGSTRRQRQRRQKQHNIRQRRTSTTGTLRDGHQLYNDWEFIRDSNRDSIMSLVEEDHKLEQDEDRSLQSISSTTSSTTSTTSTKTTRRTTSTIKQKDNTVTFNLRLHWEEGACWQNEWIERKWCLQCPGSSCVVGDELWINECDEYDPLQRFELVYLGRNANNISSHYNKHLGLLKVASNNDDDDELCLRRVSSSTFQLAPCDHTNIDQQLVGFDPYKPFELQPANQEDGINQCLSQDHDPKPYELVRSIPCYVARRDSTSYWNFYKRSATPLSVTPRSVPCSYQNPCVACQGDCDADSDCQGTLRCYQR